MDKLDILPVFLKHRTYTNCRTGLPVCRRFADRLTRQVVFALKLRFDCGLVNHRPYLLNPAILKLIEYVFCE